MGTGKDFDRYNLDLEKFLGKNDVTVFDVNSFPDKEMFFDEVRTYLDSGERIFIPYWADKRFLQNGNVLSPDGLLEGQWEDYKFHRDSFEPVDPFYFFGEKEAKIVYLSFALTRGENRVSLATNNSNVYDGVKKINWDGLDRDGWVQVYYQTPEQTFSFWD